MHVRMCMRVFVWEDMKEFGLWSHFPFQHATPPFVDILQIGVECKSEKANALIDGRIEILIKLVVTLSCNSTVNRGTVCNYTVVTVVRRLCSG